MPSTAPSGAPSKFNTCPRGECIQIDATNPQCEGGQCNQRNTTNATCTLGECTQEDAFQPSCFGGNCTQTGAIEPECSGGQCDQTNTTNATCEMGTCVQFEAVEPSCLGGSCTQIQAYFATCLGGSCGQAFSISSGCEGGGCDQSYSLNASCHQGSCNQAYARNPTCHGGLCNQERAHNPTCWGGQCNQRYSLNPFCPGGGCDITGCVGGALCLITEDVETSGLKYIPIIVILSVLLAAVVIIWTANYFRKHHGSMMNMKLEITRTFTPHSKKMLKRDPASLTFSSYNDLSVYTYPVRVSTSRNLYATPGLGSAQSFGGSTLLPSEGSTRMPSGDIECDYLQPTKSPSVSSQRLKKFITNRSRRVSSNGRMRIYSHQLTKIKKVGSGSFGTVWKGKYIGVYVAIKEVNSKASNMQKRALQNEVDCWARLPQHPNICRLLGYVRNGSQEVTSIVTEWVENGSVLDCLRSGLHFNIQQKYSILWQVSSALTLLHERGFVHRDIALRNILIDLRIMSVKVSDFGMTRITQIHDSGSTQNPILPIAWSAPESISYHEFSEKTDVWAFAVLIWELLTELQPYEGQNLAFVGIGVAAGTKTLEPMDDWEPKIQDICRKCWSFKKENRPSMRQIGRIFELLRGQYSFSHQNLVE